MLALFHFKKHINDLSGKITLFPAFPHQKHVHFFSLIITITNSSILIGAFTTSFFTYHSGQFKLDSIIQQLAVIRHLYLDIWGSQSYQVHSAKSTNHRIDHNNQRKTRQFPKKEFLTKDIVSNADINITFI